MMPTDQHITAATGGTLNVAPGGGSIGRAPGADGVAGRSRGRLPQKPEVEGSSPSRQESPTTAAPLVTRDTQAWTHIPGTWVVVQCEQGCDESWVVDVADFEPKMTLDAVEDLLTPLLLTHEVEHGKW